MPNDSARITSLERELKGIMNENLVATNKLVTTVALLGQSIDSNNASHLDFEKRTEKAMSKLEERTSKDITKLFVEVDKIKTAYSEGKTDREIMENMRNVFVKYVVTGVLGLMGTLAGGAYYMVVQISKLTGGS